MGLLCGQKGTRILPMVDPWASILQQWLHMGGRRMSDNHQTIDALFVIMGLLDDVKDWCLLRIEELDS